MQIKSKSYQQPFSLGAAEHDRNIDPALAGKARGYEEGMLPGSESTLTTSVRGGRLLISVACMTPLILSSECAFFFRVTNRACIQ